MSQSHLLDLLASAEMEFARFNAQRTCTSRDSEVHLSVSKHLRWLSDSSRPTSAYYNRAIAKNVGGLPPKALGELPGSVAAVELRPSEIQPNMVDALLAAGFRPAASLCYLTMRPPLVRLAPEQPVKRLTETQTDFFFDLLESVGTPFSRERRAEKQRYYCTEQFQAFVVADAAGSVLGWSTMFRGGHFAFLGNSYTRPEARGRGVHSALLAARLNAAADAEVEHIFTDVEHGSQSHANCERIGLRTVAVNTIWERQT